MLLHVQCCKPPLLFPPLDFNLLNRIFRMLAKVNSHLYKRLLNSKAHLRRSPSQYLPACFKKKTSCSNYSIFFYMFQPGVCSQCVRNMLQFACVIFILFDFLRCEDNNLVSCWKEMGFHDSKLTTCNNLSNFLCTKKPCVLKILLQN